MATLITYTRTDSLDPRIGTDVEDVVFFNPLTGEKLEIQLGAANRKHFENHLAKLQKYIDAAEVVEVPVVETKPKAAAKNSENAKIRVWARENGFTIGDRGRISAEIMTAYTAATEVIDSTEQPDAEVIAHIDPVTGAEAPVETVQEDGPSKAEVASTEDEIMKAYEAGQLSADAVMELLDEVTGNVDESTEQE